MSEELNENEVTDVTEVTENEQDVQNQEQVFNISDDDDFEELV